jgi:hypothetical protein
MGQRFGTGRIGRFRHGWGHLGEVHNTATFRASATLAHPASPHLQTALTGRAGETNPIAGVVRRLEREILPQDGIAHARSERDGKHGSIESRSQRWYLKTLATLRAGTLLTGQAIQDFKVGVAGRARTMDHGSDSVSACHTTSSISQPRRSFKGKSDLAFVPAGFQQ